LYRRRIVARVSDNPITAEAGRIMPGCSVTICRSCPSGRLAFCSKGLMWECYTASQRLSGTADLKTKIPNRKRMAVDRRVLLEGRC